MITSLIVFSFVRSLTAHLILVNIFHQLEMITFNIIAHDGTLFPTRTNGFDAARQRLTFCCMKQCLKLNAPGIRNLARTYDIGLCEQLNKTCGYTTHSSIDLHPRLLNEIPRGTRRYNEMRRYRSASERSNSTVKETLNIVQKE